MSQYFQNMQRSVTKKKEHPHYGFLNSCVGLLISGEIDRLSTVNIAPEAIEQYMKSGLFRQSILFIESKNQIILK